MKQKIVGSYEIGHHQVQLVLREGRGGEFYMIPEKGKIARIKVGADCEGWWELVGWVLHEALELEYERMGCRLTHGGYMASDSCDYTFVATHPQFAEVTARVGEFLAGALPDLAAEWNKWKKEAKAKRRSAKR